jgi:hypothetical protein
MAARVDTPIYLADFTCFDPPEELRVDFEASQQAAWRWKVRPTSISA